MAKCVDKKKKECHMPECKWKVHEGCLSSKAKGDNPKPKKQKAKAKPKPTRSRKPKTPEVSAIASASTQSSLQQAARLLKVQISTADDRNSIISKLINKLDRLKTTTPPKSKPKLDLSIRQAKAVVQPKRNANVVQQFNESYPSFEVVVQGKTRILEQLKKARGVTYKGLPFKYIAELEYDYFRGMGWHTRDEHVLYFVSKDRKMILVIMKKNKKILSKLYMKAASDEVYYYNDDPVQLRLNEDHKIIEEHHTRRGEYVIVDFDFYNI